VHHLTLADTSLRAVSAIRSRARDLPVTALHRVRERKERATHPCEASLTSCVYVHKAPDVTRGAGRFHALRRCSSSSAGTRTSIVFLTACASQLSRGGSTAHVDADPVAILDEADRAALGRFGHCKCQSDHGAVSTHRRGRRRSRAIRR